MEKKKKTPQQRGKASREKGKRGELKVAHMLTERGFPARRGVQFKGGANSHDVICEKLDYYNIEVKFVETLNLIKAMAQANRDCDDKQRPIVVHKKNHSGVMVTMNFADWVNLVQWAHNYVDKYNYLEIDRGRFTDKTEEVSDEDLL